MGSKSSTPSSWLSKMDASKLDVRKFMFLWMRSHTGTKLFVGSFNTFAAYYTKLCRMYCLKILQCLLEIFPGGERCSCGDLGGSHLSLCSFGGKTFGGKLL